MADETTEPREKIYVACIFCERAVEIFADAKEKSKITHIWGKCPICGANYDVRKVPRDKS